MAYQSFSMSVIGESHKSKNIVMQDFSGNIDKDIKIAVISDGHGSPNCFRSDKGSKFAIEVCLEGMSEFAKQYCNPEFNLFSEDSNIMVNILRQLCVGITSNWNKIINVDLKQNKIEKDELKNCDAEWSSVYEQGNSLNHIYGATLIGILVSSNSVIVLQQGDGKCIFLSQDGGFSQPVPLDDRCFSNVTTSLCDNDAITSFRLYYQRLDVENPLVAIFAASDGIEDSYRNDEIMYNCYRRLCIYAIENDLDEMVRYYTEKELPEISKMGSGDDMSIAGVMDCNLLKEMKSDFEISIKTALNEETANVAYGRMKSMEKKRKYLKEQVLRKEEEEKKLQNKLDVIKVEENKVEIKLAKLNEEKTIFEREREEKATVADKSKEIFNHCEGDLQQIEERYQKSSAEYKTDYAHYKSLSKRILLKIDETNRDDINEILIKRRNEVEDLKRELKICKALYGRSQKDLASAERELQSLNDKIDSIGHEILEVETQREKIDVSDQEISAKVEMARADYKSIKEEWATYEEKYKHFAEEYAKAKGFDIEVETEKVKEDHFGEKE